MSAITKERVELFIKNPLDNGLTRGEQMELARIALASLEAEPLCYLTWHQGFRAPDDCEEYVVEAKPGDKSCDGTPAFPVYTAPPAPVSVPAAMEMDDDFDSAFEHGKAVGWNAYRAAMFQSGNFRENKNSSTNNFREIAETSTNYPVIPSEVLSAIQKVAKIRADFDDFDGDRRGIGDCLDEAEQELIVTINKYASQLAAEPIAPNDVREQTAIPQVPVTPDGWISCSERMPDDGQHVIILCDGAFVLYAQYRDGEFFDIVRNGDEFFETQSRNVTHWMPLPEPPLEVNRG
ncbi:TPA: DUF551 domain-containing protein [Escherichia coli]|nr:DUF551 domain-containing protein [Escherichia coli]